VAKGWCPPSSPEYRRAQSRLAAQRKREYSRWLADPVAQEAHALKCAEFQRQVRVDKVERLKLQLRENYKYAREAIPIIRDFRSRGRKAFANTWIQRLADTRRSIRATWQELEHALAGL
jgi:hypothetical protein